MGTLIIERKKELTNIFRNYNIYVDGKKAGMISQGQTWEMALAPGKHEIICKIDWCSSNAVLVSGDVDMISILQVSGFKNSAWLMPVAGAVAAIAVILRILEIPSRYLLVVLIPAFLIMIYYLTIGRRNYLTLAEK